MSFAAWIGSLKANVARTRAGKKCRRPGVKLWAEQLEDRTLLSPYLTLSLDSHTIVENGSPNSTTATVTRVNADNSVPMTTLLTSSAPNEATIPASVVIPAGQDSASFTVSAGADTVADGTQMATISGLAGISMPLALDTSFGAGGEVAQVGETQAVALQTDGKILTAGLYHTGNDSDFYDFIVSRYNTDGSPDTSFGGSGSVITDVTGQSDKAEAVAIQSDGKIVVGGVGGNGPTFEWILVRYNTDGTLDPSFGSGGKVILPAWGATYYNELKDIAIQPDGKILGGGNIDNGVNGSDFGVVRLNADGSIDTSFGFGGKVSTNMGIGDYASGMALQSDGKIILAGSSHFGSYDSQFALVRYTSDGTLDTSFGSGGTDLTDVPGHYQRAFDVIEQPDGNLVVVGSVSPTDSSTFDVALARYNTDGTFDTSFGSQGIVVSDFGASELGLAVGLQPDGQIVVVGVNGPLLARFNSDGNLESSLFVPDSNSWKADLSVAADGHIVVAGSGQFDGGAFVAQYDAFLSLSASDTVNVVDGDQPPVANDDAYSVDESSTLTVDAAIGVLANDTDPDGDPLHAVLVSGPADGSLTLNADGSFSYAPSANFNGTDSFTYKANDGSLDSNVATVTIAVTTAPPTLTLTGDASVNEGSLYTLNLSSSNLDQDSITGWTITWGDGAVQTVTGNPPSMTHTYADGPNDFTISATATDEDGSFSANSLGVHVYNVAPEAGLSGPANGVPGQPRTFSFSAFDASPVDQAAGFTYGINWGDGNSQTISRTAGNVALDHVYTAPGSYTVQVTATDKDGGISTTAGGAVKVERVQMQGGTLAVGGTPGKDTITLSPADSSGDINVSAALNGAHSATSLGTFLPTDHILVYGQSGNDTIQLVSKKINRVVYYITVPAFLYGGGTGTVTLNAGGSTANNVLIGGGGTNTITGGLGRDLLIAGLGASKLNAGSGDDILIGGWTDYDLSSTNTTMTYDQKFQALEAIMAEWGRTDADYSTRINDLTGTDSGGLNGSYLLNASTTVHGNGKKDTLTGTTGAALDWFFADVFDVVKNKRTGEMQTLIS